MMAELEVKPSIGEFFEVDFTTDEFSEITLFTGRKTGKKARPYFNIKKADGYKFIANQNQVITSSYFLGLIGDELAEILDTVDDINALLERVDTTSLNETSKNECVRAIKRGLRTQGITL
ncbi:hypothetical protein ACA877_003278 [Vibrio alginolyticus]|uniref:hypothetical protein n=1 Tax=Vibrio alginolyticus TaxID=663 RepID=UPI00215BB819|nr:hypothetical protein [Vibrio alginolyticus]ELB2881599.1 hypothetical protein [Vibrio alginolyticus]MCR9574705.1 hypothetical protein [Vibrio alginolyticus]